MWSKLIAKQVRPKNVFASSLIVFILFLLFNSLWNNASTSWTIASLPLSIDKPSNGVFVKDAANQRQPYRKLSTPLKFHCKWPPRDIRELLNPQTGQYDLALRPCVDSSAYNNPASWYERYYQLLTILKTQTVAGSAVQRAVQIEQELRIDPSSHNYHLYPLSIDVEETVRAIRAGRPVKHHPIYDPSWPVLRRPKAFCQPETENPVPADLIVVIKSCVRCEEQRMKARNTYMQPHLWRNFSIHFAFATGIPQANFTGEFHFDGMVIQHSSHGNEQRNVADQLQRLMNESSQYGDLLIGEFADHYFSLTTKQIFIQRWISAFCNRESKLFLFLDHDFAVVPTNLIRFVRSLPAAIQPQVSAGILRQNQGVPRQEADEDPNRWSISESEFPWDSYAPYYAGHAYVLGLEAVTNMAVAGAFIQPLRIEDAHMGTVRYKLHIPTIGLRHFVHRAPTAMELENVTCVNQYNTDKLMDWSTGRIKWEYIST